MNKKVFSSLAISLLIFTSLMISMLIPLRVKGQLLEGDWTVRFENESEKTLQFPYYKRTYGPSEAIFSYIPQQDDFHTLALIWPDVTSFSVYWNDNLIHTSGDPTCPTADFWNHYHLVELPEPPDGSDVLTLKATGYYGINFGRIPFIGERTVLIRQAFFHNLIYNQLPALYMGATLLLSLLLLFLPSKEVRIKNSSRLLGIAAILACIHVLDYLYLETLGTLFSYVLIKKIFYFCGPLASLLFTLSLENYYKGKVTYSRFLVPPVLASFLVILIFKLERVRYLLPFVNIVIFANLLFIIVIIMRHQGNRMALAIVAQIILLSVLETLLVLFLKLPWPLVIQNILLFSTFLYGIQLFTIYNEIYHKHRQLEGENLRDPLTGALNRRSLEQIDPADYELVTVIDLDNFKYYNDTYGHQEGDELLKKIVHILQRNLRKDDLFIRYGGDEFIVYIKYASLKDGTSIFKRIEKEFSSSVHDSKVSFSYGIEPAHTSSPDSIKRADSSMYAMKKSKKQENGR